MNARGEVGTEESRQGAFDTRRDPGFVGTEANNDLDLGPVENGQALVWADTEAAGIGYIQVDFHHGRVRRVGSSADSGRWLRSYGRDERRGSR